MTAASPSHALFRSIELRVRRYIAGRAAGDQLATRLGPGSEAEEVVRYRPGEDDVRRIDWNVTARSQEPHVWRSRAEHDLETWVLVDDSASMRFGTALAEKADVAIQAASAIALMTDRPGNRVGITHMRGGTLEWSQLLSPRTSAVRVLRQRDPGSYATDAAEDALSLAEGLTRLDQRRRRTGMRVIVTDFVEPNGETKRPFDWEQALRRLAARHEVLVVEVVDPRELELVDIGPVVLVDPETGHRCEVFTSSKSMRERYALIAASHRRQVAEAVTSAGAAHVVLRTDQDWLRVLARHVMALGQRPHDRSRRSKPTRSTP